MVELHQPVLQPLASTDGKNHQTLSWPYCMDVLNLSCWSLVQTAARCVQNMEPDSRGTKTYLKQTSSGLKLDLATSNRGH